MANRGKRSRDNVDKARPWIKFLEELTPQCMYNLLAGSVGEGTRSSSSSFEPSQDLRDEPVTVWVG